jgi:hypothetical protein
MAKFLDPKIPEPEQIEALLEHANKEFALTVNFYGPEVFKAAGNLQSAFF